MSVPRQEIIKIPDLLFPTRAIVVLSDIIHHLNSQLHDNSKDRCRAWCLFLTTPLVFLERSVDVLTYLPFPSFSHSDTGRLCGYTSKQFHTLLVWSGDRPALSLPTRWEQWGHCAGHLAQGETWWQQGADHHCTPYEWTDRSVGAVA